jgi:hypothetical protein
MSFSQFPAFASATKNASSQDAATIEGSRKQALATIADLRTWETKSAQSGPAQTYYADMVDSIRSLGRQLQQLGVSSNVYEEEARKAEAYIKADPTYSTLLASETGKWDNGHEKQNSYLLLAPLTAYEKILNDLPKYQTLSNVSETGDQPNLL